MNDYLNVIRNNYANFQGRARRREFWMFSLISGIIGFILYLPLVASMPAIMAAQDTGEVPTLGPLAIVSAVLMGLYSLAVLVPSLAVTVRRLHDTGKSGWWYLLSFIPLGSLVLIVFLVMDGEPGVNKWGPNPKGVVANPAVTAGNNW